MKKRHFCILNSEIKYYYYESGIIIFNMKCLKNKLSKNLVNTTLQTRKKITKNQTMITFTLNCWLVIKY